MELTPFSPGVSRAESRAGATAAFARAPRPAVAALPGAAAAGARTGLILAALVAAWVIGRLALWAADAPELLPLLEAIRFTADAEGARGPFRDHLALLAAHLGAAALVGAGMGVALRPARCSWAARVIAAVLVVATEYAACRLAAWHVGPWVRAVVWYHLVTATLTLVVTLEVDRADGDVAHACGNDAWGR